MSDKIFMVKGSEEMLSDEELIRLIECGDLKGSDEIRTADFPYIRIRDTIYQFYLKEEQTDETL